MSITLRKAAERGVADFGWLDSRHTFSFGHYHDPAHMGFGPLRVINDDRVAPGGGFPPHPHADMEIVSYVVDGGLEHKDSIGTGSVIRPGEIQRMSAGTGIRHSEYNASQTDSVHFLQIWIVPERKGLPPSYAQAEWGGLPVREGLRLIASGDAREGSVRIHRDVDLYNAHLDGTETAELALRPGRIAWVQVVRGSVSLNELALAEGDGAAIEQEAALRLHDGEAAEVLVFDMAP